MKKPAKSMMGIASPTGSHLPVLEKATRDAAGGIVIEHGAGLYSTPLLARLGCRVILCEPHPGWAEWANWIYEGRAEFVDSYKRLIERLSDAAVVFLDGPARERGVLLQQCLDRSVPVIIAHDTNEDEMGHYGFQPHMFKHPGYSISHHAEDTHRTTLWVRRSS